MTTLVLLPGMDGTGELFRPLLPHLPNDLKPKVISYPTRERLDYDELAENVMAQLPSGPFALLGESFSGPVAVAVAARRAPTALILACSFIASPRPALCFLRPLLGLLPSPSSVVGPLSLMLMGRHATRGLRDSLVRSLAMVSPEVLRHRAAMTLSADAKSRFRQLTCPVLYLQAAQDRVVPASCAASVLSARPDTSVLRLAGPHFLLQCQPAAAAEGIAKFLGRASSST